MKYTIKPEYLGQWGAEANLETVLTEEDVEMVCRGWETPVEDVLDQLSVYNYPAAVGLMDDEIREQIHAELAPCTEIEFMREYEKRHLEKFGKPFEY